MDARLSGLTGRMTVAGAILVLLIGGSFLSLNIAVRELHLADDQVTVSLERLRSADQAQRLAIDMETGLRGFVITHDERFLEPWDAGRQAFPSRVSSLADSIDDPTQAARVQAIIGAGSAYIEQYGLPLIAAVRSNDPSAASVTMTETGKQRIDELRSLLEGFTEAERETYISRQEAAGGLARSATAAATVGFAASVGLIALFVVYLGRMMVRPITKAARMAGRLAAGDLSVRMPGTGTAEIGTLERSFNSLAASLEDSQAVQHRLVDQQSALRRVATLVAQGGAPDEVLAAVARELAQHLPSELAFLWRHEMDGRFVSIAAWEQGHGPVDVAALTPLGDSIADRAWQSMVTTRIDDLARLTGPAAGPSNAMGMTSSIACPVIVAGERWGVLEAARRTEPLAHDADEWMTAFTELVGTAIANANARAEVTASRLRIVAASDDARRRIERNLHDGAQQLLVSLGLRLRTLAAVVPPEQTELRAQIEQLAGDVTRVIDELREISRGSTQPPWRAVACLPLFARWPGALRSPSSSPSGRKCR